LSNQDYEELLDYRRSVSELYAQARDTGTDAPRRCERFREKRDELFKYHPQSALLKEARADFEGLDYYDYNPALRFALSIDHDVEPETFEVHLQDDGLMRMARFGKVRFPIGGEKLALSLFWISGYGGGVLLPFRDATSGEETYGGGRYLLDTIKHADLGSEGDKLIIDFNYAYNPSCAYNPSWHCPLAPMENRLPVKIPAGEKAYLG
jgi:uncharacterized protein (DUF1684 family)